MITYGESLALYRTHTFMKKDQQKKYSNNFDDEDDTILCIESSARFESIYPGTVTVQGFGMECWYYEMNFGKPRTNTVFFNCADMPSLPAKKILRRLDELRRFVGKFGWNPTQDDADLREFTGNMGYAQQYSVRDF